MTKQRASKSRKKARVGFKKKPKGPDWSVDGEYLVWNRNGGMRIHCGRFSAFPHHVSSAPDIGDTKPLSKRDRAGVVKLLEGTDDEEFRISVLWKLLHSTRSGYFKSGSIAVASKKVHDCEKMFLLQRISYLQGWKFGKKVSNLLAKVRWENKKFIDRWDEYVSVISAAITDDSERSDIKNENKIVHSLPNTVTLYRGFNVSHEESIRDPKRWTAQKAGAGPYYALTEGLALLFACSQKWALGQRWIKNGRLPSREKEIFNGKIALATYSVPRDKIYMFNGAPFGKGECICHPKDVSLESYRFCGIGNLRNMFKIVQG